MPITTISQFPNTDTLNDTDLFLVAVPGVTNKNISWGQMKTLIVGSKEWFKELNPSNTVWMPTNVDSTAYFTNSYLGKLYATNFYVTNISTEWITNDFQHSVVATSIPRISFSSAEWGMIIFGAIISIICIARIYTALRWNK